MKDKKQLLGTAAALFTNVIFGFSFLFSKVALGYAHPLMILSVRFTVAFLILNILWLTGVFKLSFKGKSKKRILLMALAQPLCYYIFELYGINNSSSAMSGVIISLVPVAVIILAGVFLHERATLRQILFSALSLMAVAIISIMTDDGAQSSPLGILLLLGAVVCAAVFNILSRDLSAEYSPIERTYIMFFAGCVGFNIISPAVLGKSYISELTSAVCEPMFWGAIAYLSVASSIIAFLCYNYSTTVLTPVKSASFSNLITVVSVLAGIFILGESMTSIQLVCCALIVAGVIGTNSNNTQKQESKNDKQV